ncbi:MAG: LEPR-XLL domain-containing protein, partial [Acidobacteriota bacterium]
MAKRRGRINTTGLFPFWRWGSRKRPAHRTKRKLLFETLEPRVLLDADPIPLNGILDLSGEQTDLAITVSASATGEITVSGSSVSDGTYTGVTGIIGSGGDDLFIGPSASATWNVTGQDSGQLSFGQIQIDFSGIENLQGAADSDDTFVVAPEGDLSGGIEGGAGGNDTLTYSPDKTFAVNGIETVVETAIDVSSDGGVLDLSAETGDLTFTITAPGEVTVTGADAGDFSYTGVSSIIGGSGDDVLAGPDGGASWTISGADSGQILFGAGSTLLDFSGVESLQGGAGADDFTVDAAGSLSGDIYGGAGTDSLVINGNQAIASGDIESSLRYPTDGIVDLSGEPLGQSIVITVTGDGTLSISGSQGSDGDYAGVVSLVGSGGEDLLVGPDQDATWQLTGTDAGQLTFGAAALDFSGIESLLGGSGADAFDIAMAGALTGTLDGGAGNDTIVIVGTQPIMSAGVETTVRYAADGVVDLSAEVGNVTITITGADTVMVSGSAASDGEYLGVTSVVGGGGDDQLVGPSSGATWWVTGRNTGQVSFGGGAIAFSAIENLRGADGADDHFRFRGRGNLTGSIDGGSDGADTLVIRGGQSVASEDVEMSTDPNGTTIAVDGVLDLSAETDDLIFTVTAAGTVIVHRTDESDTTYTGVTSVVGGAGLDVLVGPGEAASWNVTGADAGQVQFDGGAASLGFSGIESLEGADDVDDAFTIAVGGSLSGAIDGGAGGLDSLVVGDGQTVATSNIEIAPIPDDAVALDGVLDLSAETDDLSFTVLAEGVVAVSGSQASDGVYTGVTGIVGGSGNDELTGPVRDAAWDVTGTDEGQVSFAASVLAFSSIENLRGAENNDTFVIAATGDVTGSIDGGEGAADSLTSQAASALDVSGFESITDLQGLSEDATWQVTGRGTG